MAIGLFAAKSIGTAPKAELSPVSNLKATVDGNQLTLTWDAPVSKREVVLNESFEAGVIPSTWKNVDADGDGYFWVAGDFSGANGTANCASSARTPIRKRH